MRWVSTLCQRAWSVRLRRSQRAIAGEGVPLACLRPVDVLAVVQHLTRRVVPTPSAGLNTVVEGPLLHQAARRPVPHPRTVEFTRGVVAGGFHVAVAQEIGPGALLLSALVAPSAGNLAVAEVLLPETCRTLLGIDRVDLHQGSPLARPTPGPRGAWTMRSGRGASRDSGTR